LSTPTTTISIRLDRRDLARVDEMRGGVSRSAFVRELLRQSGPLEEVATRTEAMAILSGLARNGRVSAAIALARELRGDRPVSELEDFLRGE
jgi:hypothetical protein